MGQGSARYRLFSAVAVGRNPVVHLLMLIVLTVIGWRLSKIVTSPKCWAKCASPGIGEDWGSPRDRLQFVGDVQGCHLSHFHTNLVMLLKNPVKKVTAYRQ